ncbi:MAG TPA: hypothetical protein VH478_25555 [Trebonia sp.]|jgi:hypothetical protein|nr:hypothetical protein [Trebonia sp.]
MSQPLGMCPGCGGDEPFEQIHPVAGECPDVPGGECPEWACTSCGAGVIMGTVPQALADAGSGRPQGPAAQARQTVHAA